MTTTDTTKMAMTTRITTTVMAMIRRITTTTMAMTRRITTELAMKTKIATTKMSMTRKITTAKIASTRKHTTKIIVNDDLDKKYNGNNQFDNFKKTEEKKTYNQQEERKTKGSHHGNKHNKFSERGSNYDSYKQQDGEGRLAYLARVIKSWRDSQS